MARANGKFPKMSHGLTVSFAIARRVIPHGNLSKMTRRIHTLSVASQTMATQGVIKPFAGALNTCFGGPEARKRLHNKDLQTI